MDEKIRRLLNELPDRPPRSKLEPHAEVIRELRKKRRTYQEIAAFLQEHLQVKVAPSTIFEFVKRRRRMTTKRELSAAVQPAERPNLPPANPGANEVRERIRMLKEQPVTTSAEPKRFEFDPEQPLKLHPERKEK